MKKIIGTFIFWLMGWKLVNDIDTDKVRSCVLVCAPHTSNWDFIITIAAFWKMKIPMKVFIKDSWTKPWYGVFIKWLGGIGVNREQRHNLTLYAAGLLKNPNERLYLVNTPEGTRSYVDEWKKGFYYIAIKGDVPIVLAFADYKHKTAGVGKVIENPAEKPIAEIFDIIEDFYKDKTGKFPEKFNKKIH